MKSEAGVAWDGMEWNETRCNVMESEEQANEDNKCV